MVNGKIQAVACKIQAFIIAAVGNNILLRIQQTEVYYHENKSLPHISIPGI